MKILMLSGGALHSGPQGMENINRHLDYARNYEGLLVVSIDKSVPFYECKSEDFTYWSYPLKNFGAYLKRVILCSRRVDIILTQDLFFTGIFGVVISLLMRKPLVVQSHTSHFQIIKQSSTLKKIIFRCFLKISARRARGIRVVNEREALSLGNLNSNIEILPVPLYFPKHSCLTEYENSLVDLASRKRTIVWVGRFSKEKNLEALFSLSGAISSDYQILLIGEDTGYKFELKSEAERLGITNIHFSKSGISNDSLSQLLSVCFVLVQPSKYEGFGRIVMEAYLSNLKTLSSQNDGSLFLERIIGGLEFVDFNKENRVLLSKINTLALIRAVKKDLDTDEKYVDREVLKKRIAHFYESCI